MCHGVIAFLQVCVTWLKLQNSRQNKSSRSRSEFTRNDLWLSHGLNRRKKLWTQNWKSLKSLFLSAKYGESIRKEAATAPTFWSVGKFDSCGYMCNLITLNYAENETNETLMLALKNVRYIRINHTNTQRSIHKTEESVLFLANDRMNKNILKRCET